MDFRTDLAVERRDLFKKVNKISDDIPGIKSEDKQVSDTIHVYKVDVTDKNGEDAIQKPIGTYVTIDVKKMKNIDEEEKEKIAYTISSELKELIKKQVEPEDEILIVGLGNLYSTPDSLGPKVIQNIDVTRHIFKYLPQYVNDGDREVSAISPGVLGSTGIETQEILKGIVQNIKPKLIIAIDSLASKSVQRISSSIQLSDTGIIPGAGVGNKRRELSKETLGVPVIAIGIPTVLDFATIVSEGLDLFIENLQDKAMSNEYLNNLKEKDNYDEVKDMLNVGEYNMIVTPKEIDELVDNMKDVVAKRNKYCFIRKIYYCAYSFFLIYYCRKKERDNHER